MQAVAAETAEGRELWIANLTGDRQAVTLEGAPSEGRLFVLDAETFVEATGDPDASERLSRPFSGTDVELGPYAVAHIRSQ